MTIGIVVAMVAAAREGYDLGFVEGFGEGFRQKSKAPANLSRVIYAGDEPEPWVDDGSLALYGANSPGRMQATAERIQNIGRRPCTPWVPR
jgi:hypothetical protein